MNPLPNSAYRSAYYLMMNPRIDSTDADREAAALIVAISHDDILTIARLLPTDRLWAYLQARKAGLNVTNIDLL